MKCDCGNDKGGTTFTECYVGEYRINSRNDYQASFECRSCGRYAEVVGPNQEWARKALERKWNKLLEVQS